MSSSGRKEEKEWALHLGLLRTYTPAIRRLYSALRRDLSPEYFELLPYETLQFELIKWIDSGCWFVDTHLRPLLTQSTHSFRFQIRGVKATMSALHLCLWFEDQREAARFHKVEAAVEGGCQSFGLEYQKLKFVSVPFVRFKSTFSHKHLPSLERWEECDFGTLQATTWQILFCGTLYYNNPLSHFICHRGNLSQKVLEDENKPDILDQRINEGYHIELDVWVKDDKYFLGHDRPETKIEWSWLMKHLSQKYIHCKDGATLEHMILRSGQEGFNPNLFYHTVEDYAITTRGSIIVLPGKKLLTGSINMMPELASEQRPLEERRKALAVCSDSLSYLNE